MNDRFIPWCGRGFCSKCYDGVLCEHETILDKNGEVIGYMREEMARQDKKLTSEALRYAIAVTMFSMMLMLVFTVVVAIVQFQPYLIFIAAPVAIGFVVWVVTAWTDRMTS